MNVPFFDLTRQHQRIRAELDEAYRTVVDSGWYILGDRVREFEHAFATYTGAAHCVGCANGTDALALALQALGVSAGDEVIVPAFGWISPALAVKRAGAMPVFADVCPLTYNITPESVAACISEHTKVVIVIHLFGLPCDIAEIALLCEKRGVYLIEDCAQAHGARVAGRHVGTFGHFGTFSFYPTKNLGALGDGGCVISNDENLAATVRSLANYGKTTDGFTRLGRNSRLDELQAAILLVKLKHLDEWNLQREVYASYYRQAFQDLPLQLPSGKGHVWYQFVVRSEHRDRLQQYLESAGVATMVHYPEAVHCSGIFETSKVACPEAERAAKEVLSLPVFVDMKEEELAWVALIMQEFHDK